MLGDYAEGTWTPAAQTGGVSYADAKYVKVGNLVHLFVRDLVFGDITNNIDIRLLGMPYVPVAAQHAGGAFWRSVDAGKTGNNLWIDTIINTTTPYISFYLDTGASAFTALQHSDLTDSNNAVQFSATYITS